MEAQAQELGVVKLGNLGDLTQSLVIDLLMYYF
jgi:hypothetical protein